ncbi:MAG TPA: hypothetical protein PLF63_04800 [Rubrivivax sp.]|jgi:hypothetical protein|nr:hypothetical protein [Rubrivivax sp.]
MPDATPRLVVQLRAPVKAWWLSRTLWLNAAALALAAAEERLGLLQGLLPVSTFEFVAFALPVLNVALRLVTHTAIGGGTDAPADPAEEETA